MRVKVISDSDVSAFEAAVDDFLSKLDKKKPSLHGLHYQYSGGVYSVMISYFE